MSVLLTIAVYDGHCFACSLVKYLWLYLLLFDTGAATCVLSDFFTGCIVTKSKGHFITLCL